jgi:Potassium-transporting ATPase A subunit
MSYFSQMVGLCAQNFLAGAAGLAGGVAFIRGLARQLSDTLGNFWVDLTRALLWVVLPGALIGTVLLVWQGVPMNFHHYAVVTSVEGRQQVIPRWRSSRISEQTAAASLTRMDLIPMRTPRRSRTFSKCWPLCSCLRHLPTPSAKWWTSLDKDGFSRR